MMVEPPGDLRRAGVLEVDNRILLAIKLAFIEQGARTMKQASELELHVVTDAFPVKARKQRRR